MAINPSAEFPLSTQAPTAAYPLGKAQNITAPGDGTGTPWEERVSNDIFGFQQALLGHAGLTPSGTPDSALVSQYLQALMLTIGTTHATVASMVADGRLIENTVVRIIEHTAGYGDIHMVGVLRSGVATPDDGGSVILLNNGLKWIQTFDGPPTIMQFGASPAAVANSENSGATQAALAFVGYGGTVVVPRGRFNVDTAVLLPDGATLGGFGDDSILAQPVTNNDDVIRFVPGGRQQRVRNLSVEMDRGAQANSNNYGVHVLGARDFTVEKVSVVTTGVNPVVGEYGNVGILIDMNADILARGGTVRGCRLDNMRVAVWAVGPNRGLRILDNLITNTARPVVLRRGPFAGTNSIYASVIENNRMHAPVVPLQDPLFLGVTVTIGEGALGLAPANTTRITGNFVDGFSKGIVEGINTVLNTVEGNSTVTNPVGIANDNLAGAEVFRGGIVGHVIGANGQNIPSRDRQINVSTAGGATFTGVGISLTDAHDGQRLTLNAAGGTVILSGVTTHNPGSFALSLGGAGGDVKVAEYIYSEALGRWVGLTTNGVL